MVRKNLWLRLATWAALGSVGLAATVTIAGAPGRERLDFSPAVLNHLGPSAVEHRYVMAARIRPFFFFWIRKDNVGGARVTWRRGEDGARAFELLVGSDPNRAPRRINRWGYIEEEVRGTSAELIGVMKQSDEQTIDEAQSRLEHEGEGDYVYKAIRTSIKGGQAMSGVTRVRVKEDLTYRDIGTLLERLPKEPPGSRVARLPEGTQPGFLTSLADLIHDSVEARRKPGQSDDRSDARSVPFVYNGKLYDLTLRSSEFLPNAGFEDRSYGPAIRGQFDVRSRATGEKTPFEMVYGLEGALAEIPVRVVFRPRWWFEAELLLDDTTPF